MLIKTFETQRLTENSTKNRIKCRLHLEFDGSSMSEKTSGQGHTSSFNGLEEQML